MANIKVADLNDDIDPTTNAHAHWFYFTANDVENFVLAYNEGDGWQFSYGHLANGFLIDGGTEGKAHYGPNGVLEIVVPDAIASEGTELLVPNVRSSMLQMQGGDPVLARFSDSAPNNLEGKDYTTGA